MVAKSGSKVAEELQLAPESAIEPPNGMYTARLDEKGRLKLPACFLKYFGELKEKTLFVTSLDRRTAQIYTTGTWRENKKFLADFKKNPAAAQNIAFNAADLGADGEIDGSGRVMFNSELRRELDMEKHDLRLFAYKGRVEVLTETIYQERKRRAQATIGEDMTTLESEGLV